MARKKGRPEQTRRTRVSGLVYAREAGAAPQAGPLPGGRLRCPCGALEPGSHVCDTNADEDVRAACEAASQLPNKGVGAAPPRGRRSVLRGPANPGSKVSGELICQHSGP